MHSLRCWIIDLSSSLSDMHKLDDPMLDTVVYVLAAKGQEGRAVLSHTYSSL
jgi:hypothetical protein